MLKSTLLISLCLLPATHALSADVLGEKRLVGEGNAGYSAFARGGLAHQMDTDIDGGGSFSVNRFFVQTGPSYSFGKGSSLSLAVGYGLNSYDFSELSSFGSQEPWEDAHSFRLSMPWRWKITEKWVGFISPTLRYTGERRREIKRCLDRRGRSGLFLPVQRTSEHRAGICHPDPVGGRYADCSDFDDSMANHRHTEFANGPWPRCYTRTGFDAVLAA